MSAMASSVSRRCSSGRAPFGLDFGHTGKLGQGRRPPARPPEAADPEALLAGRFYGSGPAKRACQSGSVISSSAAGGSGRALAGSRK